MAKDVEYDKHKYWEEDNEKGHINSPFVRMQLIKIIYFILSTL
ncbi:hypothetical protein STAWA0001_1219 [Staphylococcus warneri L37603]|nr:hypothetical protein STAWA0001_1219 [Staphylococcus warneri L37603]